MSVSDQVAPTERHQFRHDGRVIYEWNQTLHELNIYVQAPPGVRAKQLAVTITSSHLSISVAGNPPYLNVSAGPRASCRTRAAQLSAEGTQNLTRVPCVHCSTTLPGG